MQNFVAASSTRVSCPQPDVCSAVKGYDVTLLGVITLSNRFILCRFQTFGDYTLNRDASGSPQLAGKHWFLSCAEADSGVSEPVIGQALNSYSPP